MEPWKKIDETLVYDGWRKVIRKKFELPDQRIVEYETTGNISEIVCVLAMTNDQHVILAPQFRPGPEKIFYELPGGGMDTHENPEQAMARELLEETGYEGVLTLVATTAHDGYANSVRHHFVAQNCVAIAKPIADPDNVSHEVALVSVAELKAITRAGQCTDIATAYLGLDFLNLL